ncbi:hypothetical protein PSACC_02261 [Paramicrosporidium saccamoebae]|uniref:Checkpoint protein n=1 Tax=Paramicrosporidium saccamoebae TaxID=1246581 RepID=A0A2H9TJP5_9FUNG|nr:hypothetical protein PSACC_02261 [Paramicrosporidium saccamoebae]
MLAPHEEALIRFDPSTHQLRRVMQCLERTGRTVCMAFSSNSVRMLQRPTAASLQLTSWTSFTGIQLGISMVIGDICFEVETAALLSVLRAVETQSSGTMTVLSRTLQIVGGERVGIPGSVLHELSITPTESVSEPTVARPHITFHLPLGIRRVVSLEGTVEVAANAAGTVVTSVETALLTCRLRYSGVRVVQGGLDDRQRLISISVPIKLLGRTLGVLGYLPGATLLCSIIPDQTLIISVSLPDQPNVMTVYIPSFSP